MIGYASYPEIKIPHGAISDDTPGFPQGDEQRKSLWATTTCTE
ncbi:hypothetical protein [Streptomyces calidiresistens]|nr:hypothetical protein [Streptomyces calidiresistens]